MWNDQDHEQMSYEKFKSIWFNFNLREQLFLTLHCGAEFEKEVEKRQNKKKLLAHFIEGWNKVYQTQENQQFSIPTSLGPNTMVNCNLLARD